MIDKKLLLRFCSNDKTRDSLCRPFNVSGYTYATNGHIAIRVPRMVEFDANEPINSIEEPWFKGSLKPADCRIVPKVNPEFAYEKCSVCNGSGSCRECPDCDGEGEVVFCSDSGREYNFECRLCDGNGHIPNAGDGYACSECEGTGTAPKWVLVKLGSKLIACHNLLLMHRLPDCRIAPEVTSGYNAIPFIFDGGDGMVMPARDDGRLKVVTPESMADDI